MNERRRLYKQAFAAARQGFEFYGDCNELVESYVLERVGTENYNDPVIGKAITKGSINLEFPSGITPENLRDAIEFMTSFERNNQRR